MHQQQASYALTEKYFSSVDVTDFWQNLFLSVKKGHSFDSDYAGFEKVAHFHLIDLQDIQARGFD